MASDVAEICRLLDPLIGARDSPVGPRARRSRWSGKEHKPLPLRPLLLAEVSADHITSDHMRHGARLIVLADRQGARDPMIRRPEIARPLNARDRLNRGFIGRGYQVHHYAYASQAFAGRSSGTAGKDPSPAAEFTLDMVSARRVPVRPRL